MADYRLPSLGADMDKATFVQWLVQPGDHVKKGQIVAEIETAKALMEIEFFEDGTIESLMAQPGEVVEVGATIARYEPAATAGQGRRRRPKASAESPAAPAAGTDAATASPADVAAAISGDGSSAPAAEQPHASGAVRELAERLGVDLGSLTGTGNHGMIRTAEVLAAARQVGTPLERTAGGTAEPSEPRSDREVMASPRARHLAKEHGVELADVQPSGEDGTISGEDVERHLASVTAATAPGLPTPPPAAVPGAEAAPSALEPAPPGQAPPPTSSVPPAGEADRVAARRLAMRQAIADLMARSKREIPHYYLSQVIDMTRALEWLEAENLARSVADRLLPATLLVKAVARSLVEVPEMNGFWIDDRFVPGEGIHTGIAISLREGGLVAPAIHDADRKTLDELMQALRDLVARARKGVLQRAEMSDPTITVTNLGDQGVDAVYGVIYPPQVALVGFGTVAERPWAQSGMVGVRRLLTATLSADHRASDGHRGGIFLAAIDRWLQEPEQL